MARYSTSLCIVFSIAVLFLSCKKEEVVVEKNQISYDGVNYDLAGGTLLDYGIIGKDEGHTQHLYLFSSGLKNSEGYFDSTSGKGHVMYFEIFSPVASLLEEGEYVYDINKTYKASTFDDSYLKLNFDYRTNTGDLFTMFWGKISIKKAGTDYDITFDCIEGDGKHVTGYYKGPLSYYYEGR